MKKREIKNYFYDLPFELILYIFNLIPRTRLHQLLYQDTFLAKSVS